MKNLEMLLSQPVANAIGWTLIHFLWQGLVVAFLYTFFSSFLKRCSANSRYSTACGALLLLAILPVVTFGILYPESIQETRAIQLPQDKSINSINPTENTIPEKDPSTLLSHSPIKPETSYSQTSLSKNSISAIPFGFKKIEKYLPGLVVGWILGVLLLSLRLFGGWLVLQRFKRRHIRSVMEPLQRSFQQLAHQLKISRPVLYLESTLIKVPVVIGFFKPVILIPSSVLTGLTPKELEAIIAHELAHIRRHDYLVNLLQTVIETLLFYHPVVWWISGRIRMERENCCDDLAVAVCGDRVTYARALLNLEQTRTLASTLALEAAGGSLRSRITRICRISPNSSNLSGRYFAGIVTLASVLLLVLGIHFPLSALENREIEHPPDSSVLSSPKSSSSPITSSARSLPLEFPVKRNWGPEQAAGAPDTSKAGDIRTAWASLTPDDQPEWLILDYAEVVTPTGVRIYETYNPGSVNQVSLFKSDGTEVKVWEGKDPTLPEKEIGISEITFDVDFSTSRVKIYLDSPSVKGWNEIDAVGLMDKNGTTHWATQVEASSTYAQKGPNLSVPSEPMQLEFDQASSLGFPADAVVLSYADNIAESKRSVAASGHAVLYERPSEARFVEAVQIAASRYGASQAPDEDFHLYFLNDKEQVLADLAYPYGMIERVDGLRAYTLKTPSIEVSEKFFVALAFNPHQTKGIYLGLNQNDGISHSYQGLPGDGFQKIDENADWMIQVLMTPKPSEGQEIRYLKDWKPPEIQDPFKDCMEIKYDDGQSDGMQSYGSSSPIIRFNLNEFLKDKSSTENGMLKGIRLYAGRYGSGYGPEREFVKVNLLDSGGKLLAEEAFPYSLFGYKEKWVDLVLKNPFPIANLLPEEDKPLVLCFDPSAHQYKGIYFHYNQDPKHSHSFRGKLNEPPTELPDREWMIRAYLSFPSSNSSKENQEEKFSETIINQLFEPDWKNLEPEFASLIAPPENDPFNKYTSHWTDNLRIGGDITLLGEVGRTPYGKNYSGSFGKARLEASYSTDTAGLGAVTVRTSGSVRK